MIVTCPGCSEARDLGTAIQVGDVLTCDSCAGVRFRLVQAGDRYLLRIVPEASCPQCEAIVPLPDAVQPGQVVRHCDRDLMVTFAYGSYALELVATEP